MDAKEELGRWGVMRMVVALAVGAGWMGFWAFGYTHDWSAAVLGALIAPGCAVPFILTLGVWMLIQAAERASRAHEARELLAGPQHLPPGLRQLPEPPPAPLPDWENLKQLAEDSRWYWSSDTRKFCKRPDDNA